MARSTVGDSVLVAVVACLFSHLGPVRPCPGGRELLRRCRSVLHGPARTGAGALWQARGECDAMSSGGPPRVLKVQVPAVLALPAAATVLCRFARTQFGSTTATARVPRREGPSGPRPRGD